MRDLPAIVAAKVIKRLLQRLRYGGGALPGLIALFLSPHLLHRLSNQCKDGVIVVAGTNGKTTTTRLLVSILEAAGKKVVTNRSGSNLTRGHVAAFIDAVSWRGQLRADIAVLETDEAVLPETIRQTNPRLVLWNNLFRDQLDRYGEVDSIAKKWSAAAHHLSKKSLLLVNGDDPLLVHAAQSSGHANMVFFGIDDRSVGTAEPQSAVDAFASPVTQQPLRYHTYYLSHLGDFYDSTSHFRRPPLSISAQKVEAGDLEHATQLRIQLPNDSLAVTLPLPGLYNAYNGLAVVAAAHMLNVTHTVIAEACAAFQGVFGRFERLQTATGELVFALIKNPTGATEVMRTISNDPQLNAVAVLANDNFADGLDVSWYWDANFELLAPRTHHLTVAGTRALDMAVRWKYGGFKGTLVREASIGETMRKLSIPSSAGRTYVLATYTATLEAQRALRMLNLKSSHWQE